MNKKLDDNRITARDVQIGDYFFLAPLKENEEEPSIVRINSISRRKVGYFNRNSNSERYIRYCENRLIPIPFHEMFILDAIYTDDEEFSGLMKFNKLRETYNSLFKMEYVHELQHVLNMRNSHNKFNFNVDNVLS